MKKRNLLALAALTLGAPALHAASGTWNVDANGLWSLNTNWLGNTIADGSGSTAFFTNDITADRRVSLDGDRTLTSLVFGDSATATAGSWILDNSGTSTNNLILAGTTPTITVNALGTSKTATISAIIEGSAGLTKAGVGTLNLTAANTYTGSTIINGGTLKVGDGATGSLNGTTGTALTFANTGTVNFAEAAGSAQGMGLLTLTAGQGTVQSTYGGSANTTLTFSNVTARSAGATANFVQSGGTNGTTNSIILTQYNGAATVAGAFIDKGVFFNGDDYAVAHSASGYLRAMIYGTDTNTASSGTITANKHVRIIADASSRPTISLLSLNLDGNGVDYTQSDSQTLTVPAIIKSGGGATTGTIKGGTGTFLTAGANTELVIHTAAAADLLTISSVISGTSSPLTKSGAGTLTLSAQNTYTGNTTINAGTVISTVIAQNNNGGTSAFGQSSSSSTITINNGATLTTPDGGGNNWISWTGASGTGIHNVVINAGGKILAPNGDLITGIGNTTLNGGTIAVVRGVGSINASNYASFTLRGNLTVGGSVASSITEGTGVTAKGNFKINGTTTFDVADVTGSSASDLLVSARLYSGGAVGVGTGIITKTGAGTVELHGTTTGDGGAAAWNVNVGTLLVNTTNGLDTGAITVGASGTLGGTGTIGGAVTVNGTYAPGNSPGVMTHLTTLNLAGTIIMEIDGNAGAGAIGGHDFTNLTGAGALGVLTYGGVMTLDIGMIFGAGAYSWNMFDFASETGTFSTISLADKYSGSLLDTDLNGVWDLTSGDNTWQFTESTGVLGLTVVPEPRAALLGGIGMLLLLRRRRGL